MEEKCSAIINSHIDQNNQPYMKITLTPKHTTAKLKSGIHTSLFFFGLSILCCCLFSLSTIDIAAQANTSVAPVPEMSFEDYPGPKWKSPVEYSATLTSEQSNTALKLAEPNLPADELGLYTGYARMLTYMQEDMTNQLFMGDIALKNFNRVLAETPDDDILKHMRTKDFQTLYDALLPKLSK